MSVDVAVICVLQCGHLPIGSRWGVIGGRGRVGVPALGIILRYEWWVSWWWLYLFAATEGVAKPIVSNPGCEVLFEFDVCGAEWYV